MMTNDEMAIFDRIAKALEGILVTLRALALDSAPEEVRSGCQHPEESRHNFGETRGQPDWECGICGFRTEIVQ